MRLIKHDNKWWIVDEPGGDPEVVAVVNSYGWAKKILDLLNGAEDASK